MNGYPQLLEQGIVYWTIMCLKSKPFCKYEQSSHFTLNYLLFFIVNAFSNHNRVHPVRLFSSITQLICWN